MPLTENLAVLEIICTFALFYEVSRMMQKYGKSNNHR